MQMDTIAWRVMDAHRKYQIVMPVKTGIQDGGVVHSGFRPRIKAFRGRLYAPE